MQFARPAELSEALDLIGNGAWKVLAGGTDFYPALADARPTGDIIDITAIRSLCGVTEKADHWRIGALTTWSDIARLDLPDPFNALKLAAREIGSVQIQNRATIAGNLCNASPAADGVPPLLILDAEVELACASGTRQLPLQEFICGNRRTGMADDELLTAILLPRTSITGVSSFHKLGSRKYLVISIVMAAVRLLKGPDGEVMLAAVSVGACSPVAQRMPELEEVLVGKPFNAGLADIVETSLLSTLSPIDDVRAPADYRHEAAGESIRRAILDCMEQTS